MPCKLAPRPPKIMKNRRWNHDKPNFCMICPLPPNPAAWFPNPKHPDSDPKPSEKATWKQICKNHFFWSNGIQKALKVCPRNQPKIDKIQAWTSQYPRCSPMSQDRPRVSQDAKEEAPCMPSHMQGHQKSKIFLQKLPRSQHTEASEPALVSAEEFNNKNKTKQRKPNKPVSHQTA